MKKILLAVCIALVALVVWESVSTGYGVLTWASGTRYEGEFLNDQLHGRGTVYNADGSQYSGQWIEGQYIN